MGALLLLLLNLDRQEAVVLQVLKLQLFASDLLILSFLHILLIVKLIKLEFLLLVLYSLFPLLMSLSPFVFQSALSRFLVHFACSLVLSLTLPFSLTQVPPHFELLAVVISLYLKYNQSPSDLHANVSIWKHLDVAARERKRTKF